MYFVGTSTCPPYSALLFYLGYGGFVDVGVALAAIIVAKATPTFLTVNRDRPLFILDEKLKAYNISVVWL